MTNDNQDALRCADALDAGDNSYAGTSVSYYLRSLVRENEGMKHWRDAAVERMRELESDKEAKDALLRQAVQELETYTTPAQRLDGSPCREPINKQLCAAIRQHLEGRA